MHFMMALVSTYGDLGVDVVEHGGDHAALLHSLQHEFKTVTGGVCTTREIVVCVCVCVYVYVCVCICMCVYVCVCVLKVKNLCHWMCLHQM